MHRQKDGNAVERRARVWGGEDEEGEKRQRC